MWSAPHGEKTRVISPGRAGSAGSSPALPGASRKSAGIRRVVLEETLTSPCCGHEQVIASATAAAPTVPETLVAPEVESKVQDWVPPEDDRSMLYVEPSAAEPQV